MEGIKIGDRIIILSHEEGTCDEGIGYGGHCSTFDDGMEEYIGKIVTVGEVMNDCICIIEDGGNYRWSPCMFRKIRKSKKIHLMESGKIKGINYRGIVNRIGIEFEGYFKRTQEKFAQYEMAGLWSEHGDGSLCYEDINREEYRESECVTKPMEDKELSSFLGAMDKHFKDGDYRINSSCGLHFHISLKNTVFYSSICNADFFYKVVDMFKKNYPEVYAERKGNRYCASRYESRYGTERDFLRSHFRKTSGDRYHAVNFCYREHNTVEVRFYGGSHATIEGLAGAIQSVIDIIALKVSEKQTKKEAIEAPEEEARYNQPLDLVIPKVNAYKRLRAINIGKVEDLNVSLSFPIQKEQSRVMFIDVSPERLQRAFRRYDSYVPKIATAYKWDIIFNIARSAPRAFFRDAENLFRKAEGNAPVSEEELDEIILNEAIERLRGFMRDNTRKHILDYFYKDNGKVYLRNRNGEHLSVGMKK